MKKTLILSILLLGAVRLAVAYDFSLPTDAGNCLYFNILDANTVELTRDDTSTSHKYQGKVQVPAQVPLGDTQYTVAAIGPSAFFGCTDLTDVSLPNTIESIGTCAFGWCQRLTTLAIPRSTSYIAPYAFQGCASLNRFSIMGNNTHYSVSNGVLYSYDGTTLVAFPPARRGDYYLPSSVTTVAPGAFYDCANLDGMHLPLSLTSIQANAFYFCGGISQLTIPASVADIARGAFGECSQLSRISVSPDNGVFTTDGTALYRGATLLQFAPYSHSHYQVPDGTEAIAPEAFFRSYDLHSVDLPASLRAIGDAAFAECWSLESLTLPSTVDSIGFAAFALCESLGELHVSAPDPASIDLGQCAFYGVPTNSCVLYVPQGSIEAYRNAPQWSDFRHILTYEALEQQSIVWNQNLSGYCQGEMVWLEARATSGLEVEYSVTKGQELASVSGSKLKLLRPGRIEVTAQQRGNSRYKAAAEVTRSIDIAIASIEAVEADQGIAIHGGAGVIVITGAPEQAVATVHTPDGRLTYTGRGRRLIAAPGIYIVSVDTTTAKVLVN